MFELVDVVDILPHALGCVFLRIAGGFRIDAVLNVLYLLYRRQQILRACGQLLHHLLILTTRSGQLLHQVGKRLHGLRECGQRLYEGSIVNTLAHVGGKVCYGCPNTSDATLHILCKLCELGGLLREVELNLLWLCGGLRILLLGGSVFFDSLRLLLLCFSCLTGQQCLLSLL